MPNVAVFLSDTIRFMGGCEIYRLAMPLEFLCRNDPTWQVSRLPLSEVPRVYVRDEPLNKFKGLSDGIGIRRFLENHHILVFPRFFAENDKHLETMAKFIQQARRMGRVCIYEVDDDFTNEHRTVAGGGDAALRVARLCDAITVSTPYLAKLMKDRTGRPAWVVPNSIDTDMWSNWVDVPRDVNLDGLVIGLTGSPTHYNDWYVLKDVMPGILRDFPHVTFFLGGFHPEYFDPIQGEQMLREQPVRYETYSAIIHGLDIVLAPIDPNDPFNHSKSALKAVEGMAAARRLKNGKLGGAAVLATDCPVYRRAVQHRNNGLLVKHTPEDWDRALRTILTDGNLRTKLQLNSLKWVHEHRSIQKNWALWRKAYLEIMALPLLQAAA